MSIVLLDDWDTQPPYRCGINPEFGIPIFSYVGREPYDQCTGSLGSYNNGSQATITSMGGCLSTLGTTGGRLTFPATESHNISEGPWAIYMYFTAGGVALTGGYNNGVFGRDPATFAGKWFITTIVGGGDGDAIYFYHGQSGGNSNHRWPITLHNRGVTRLCISRKSPSATTLTLWLDGVSYGASTVTGMTLGAPLPGAASVEIGSSTALSTRGLRGTYSSAVLTQGVPATDTLAKKFSDNPWSLYTP